MQHARCAFFAFYNVFNLYGTGFSAGKRHQFTGVTVTNGVAQSAECIGFRIVEGECSDSGCAVSHPDACGVGAVCRRSNRLQCGGVRGVVAGIGNGQRLPIGLQNLFPQRLIAGDGSAVDTVQNIAFLQAGISRRAANTGFRLHTAFLYNHDAIHQHFDAEWLTAWNQHGGADGFDFYLFDGNEAE